jgi:membrane associated rhomboid family serine protease
LVIGLRKTIVLIILCVISSFTYWSLIRWYDDGEALTSLLVFSGESLFQGHFWVVFTALFIHADPTHLIGNTLFFYVFCTTLEDEVGALKTLIAFIVGGVLSFILSIFFYGPTTTMLGASAAIFTLTAIVMLTKPLEFSWAFLMPLGLVALLYFVYNVATVVSLGNGGSVGYMGHIIGFTLGFPFGVAWSPKKWTRNLLIAVALLIGYFIVVSLFSHVLEEFLPFF